MAGLGLADFTTDSVMLTFTTPADSPCITNYTITTNATAPPSTTDTSVIITKPASDEEGDTYFVNVSPVDFAGRMGPLASLRCFMFSGESGEIIDLVSESYGLAEFVVYNAG